MTKSTDSSRAALYPPRLLGKIQERVAVHGPDECHPWLGSTMQRTCAQPIVSIGKKNLNPRRVLYEMHLGTRLPPEQRVRDKCGNSLCCNPRHLKGGSLADRLEAQVDKSGGPEACWPWTGMKLKGYGRLRERRGTPWVFAHRLAFELAYGPIVGHRPHTEHEVVIMHACDNPACCNPVHLRAGTDADNIADMIAKGRKSRGERHSAAMKRANALRASGYVKPKRPPGRPKRRAA